MGRPDAPVMLAFGPDSRHTFLNVDGDSRIFRVAAAICGAGPAGEGSALRRGAHRAPPADPPLERILKLRGVPVSVLDLRSICRLPSLPIDPNQHLVVLDAGGRLSAIRTDGIVQLCHVKSSAIRPLGDIRGTGIDVREAVNLEHGIVFLLDAARVTIGRKE